MRSFLATTIEFHQTSPQVSNDPLALLGRMDQLLAYLKNSSIRTLIVFHDIYCEIIRGTLETKSFVNPDSIQTLNQSFFAYYEAAVRQFLTSQPVPPAWQLCFTYCLTDQPQPLLVIGLAANAHINNDLPQALRETFLDGQIVDNDYQQMNQIIRRALGNFFADDESFVGTPILLRPVQRIWTGWTVANWRRQAWRLGHDLANGQISQTQLETTAYLCGRRLQTLPHFSPRTH